MTDLIEIKRLTKAQLWQYLEEDLINVVLFGGERLYFVDEILAAFDGEVLVGAVTMSPVGEFGDGKPEIIGLRVLQGWRRQGIGAKLMERAIKRMVERGFTGNASIHIEVLSQAALNLVNKLPADLRERLDIRDNSTDGDCFDMLERMNVMAGTG